MTGAHSRRAARVIVAAVVLTSCGNDRDARWDATYRGVCGTARAAGADRAVVAERTFRNEAHAGLHRLADALQSNDETRNQAAELLRTKQAVERELTGATSAALLDATRRAIRAETGDDPGTCPD